MDRIPSIELAFKNEQIEMNFYLHEADRSNNPLAKTMFSNLAQDEKEHMERIRHLHQRLLADGSWPENMPIQVKDTNIRQVLENLADKSGSFDNHNQDDESALEKAAEFESNGSTFYARLAEACTNPMEKNFFKFLSRIEREHYLSITDSLAYLKNPETWFAQHERSGLDGGP